MEAVAIASWMLIWSVPGQFPIVIPDLPTETACKQMVEDVMKQVPKKPKAPQRHGWCIAMPATQIGEDPVATE